MKNNHINLKNYTFVDLTHALTPEIPFWEAKCGFQHQVTQDYADCIGAVKFKVQKFEMFAGIGTHMDAPAHCFSGAKTVDQIALDQLIISCNVIDVSANAHETYTFTPNDIHTFEAKYGAIEKDTFIIIHTGWGKFWNNPEKYRNTLVYPSISIAAAELLLSRNIVGLGIDTLSPDVATSEFPVHRLILGAGKYIVENIANADQLPPIGSYIMVLPIKVSGATEAPIRLIGMFEK
jgi:kynurenine formamidase